MLYLHQRSDESLPENVSSMHVVYEIAIRFQSNYNVPPDNFMGVLMTSPRPEIEAYEYWRKIKFHGHSDPLAGGGRDENGGEGEASIFGERVQDRRDPPAVQLEVQFSFV